MKDFFSPLLRYMPTIKLKSLFSILGNTGTFCSSLIFIKWYYNLVIKNYICIVKMLL